MNSIVILAQAGPNVGDFVRQVPIGPIIALCGSGLLLVVAMVFIVRARTQRANGAKQSAPPAFVPVQPATRPRAEPADLSDLPDLDLLVDDSAPPPAPTPDPKPAPPTPAPARAPKTGLFTIRTNDGSSAQAVEVVTILRDVVDGSLIVQMGDKSYRDLSDDEAFRSSFLKIMRELSPIVTQAPQQPRKQPEAVAQEPEEVPVNEAPAPEVSVDEEDMPAVGDLVEEEPAAARPAPKSTPATTARQMPGDLPKFTLEEKPQTVKTKGGLLGRTKTEFVPVPELDIPGAIEAYLQHRLQSTGDFARRSIHVHPAEDGGVAIEVDGKYYEAVGDVTDEEVRSYLAETIQEWQQRNTR